MYINCAFVIEVYEPKRAKAGNRGSNSVKDQNPLFTLTTDDLKNLLIQEMGNLREATEGTRAARRGKQLSEVQRWVIDTLQERYDIETAFEYLYMIVKPWKDLLESTNDGTGKEVMGKIKRFGIIISMI